MDDYLVTDKITAFIVQTQHAATEVLKEKQPKDYTHGEIILKLYQLMCGGPGQGVVVALGGVYDGWFRLQPRGQLLARHHLPACSTYNRVDNFSPDIIS
uniref:Uncharacterized protein n=1 Tax=Zea mays TaxID=4577 RepID=A0A804M4I8_MAIZE